MYGLPAGFDAQVFVGRSLELVSFTANTVNFFFDGALSLTVESSLCHTMREHSPSQVRQLVPLRQSGLMQLIGAVVAEAEARRDGTLKLVFSNGQELSIFDDSADYESYRIQIRDNEIVV